MNKAQHMHLFWGSFSPLASLTGGGLIIMASGRLAFALVCAGALLWVYGLSALAAFPGRKFFPKRGKTLVYVFLSAFTGTLYLLILWFANAILAMENFFIVSLVPLLCTGSGMFERAGSQNTREAVFRALGEAAVLGGCIIAFSLIREPLGCRCLSLPGGVQGIVKVFSSGEEGFLPIRAIAGSTGALLLLGYGISIYRYFRERRGYTEPEENL
ncbi:MAG: hypothetical protein LBL28_07835 [Treponema sp.]|jgi:hypothetical protein|nr:hypothetical protein [Treponema sp.]